MIVSQAFLKFTRGGPKRGLSAKEFSIFSGIPSSIFYMDEYPHWETLSLTRKLSPYLRVKDTFRALYVDPRFVFYPLAGLVAEKAFVRDSLAADMAQKSLAAARSFNPAWLEASVIGAPLRKKRGAKIAGVLDTLKLTI